MVILGAVKEDRLPTPDYGVLVHEYSEAWIAGWPPFHP
jgi:hypothetical protein